MNDFFVGLFKTDPNNITLGVLIVCLVLFLSSVKKRIREISPALMVSAGIIGTFWGTFIALSEFPAVSGGNGSSDIIESIPPVLNGMKSAFVTSLIGLIFAFVSKGVFSLAPQAQHKEDPVEKSTRELLEAIRDGINGEGDNSLSSRMQALTVENRDSMREVKQSLSGEGDSSVVAQLIKLRGDNHEDFKNLNQQMEGLSTVIRESLVEGMKDLIGELREVIVNQLTEQLKKTNELLGKQLSEMLDRIETALIEQFGKTFAEFNEATQAIKRWQEEHIVHVAQLTEAFDKSAQGIETIRADCERIPATMESLQNLMEKMGLLIGDLNVRLEAFADMKKQAEESFPSIKENLDRIGGDLEKSAAGFSGLEETIQSTFVNATTLMQQHANDTQQNMQKHADDTQQNMQNVLTQVQASTQGIMDDVQTNAQNMIKAVQESTKIMMDEVQTSVQQTIKQTNESSEAERDYIKKAAEAMMAEVQKATDKVSGDLNLMTQEYSEKMNQKMLDIGERWGRIMLGLVNTVRDEVQRSREQK